MDRKVWSAQQELLLNKLMEQQYVLQKQLLALGRLFASAPSSTDITFQQPSPGPSARNDRAQWNDYGGQACGEDSCSIGYNKRSQQAGQELSARQHGDPRCAGYEHSRSMDPQRHVVTPLPSARSRQIVETPRNSRDRPCE